MRLRTSLVVVLLAVAACGDVPVGASEIRTLRFARARWESRGIDSYELTLRQICYCGLVGPVRVVVQNGVVVSRTLVATGEPLPSVYADGYPDVLGLFAIIERAARNADDLATTYDPTYGFPVVVSIDWDYHVADDEVTYRAEAFSP